MSNYPPPGYPVPGYPPAGYPPQRPRSGCGGCLSMLLIFLGVIFLLIIAMCCGGFFYLKSYLSSSISQQPADVRQISDEIISIRTAAPLEPVAGGRFQMPIVGKSLGQGVLYADKNHKAILILASFSEMFGPQLEEQIRQALESGQFPDLPAENNTNQEKLKDVKTNTIERTIQGEKAVFEVTEGIGVQSNKARIRVHGALKGKTGPTVFILDADEETLTRKKVEEMIDSME